jgi:hypothetical protein
MCKNKFYLKNYSLFTNSIINVINRNYHFFFDFELLGTDSSQIIKFEHNHPAYLFLNTTDNLGHFFIDNFFHFYYIFRQNPKKTYISVRNQFQRDFIASAIDKKYLIFLDSQKTYELNNIFVTPTGRDLRVYSDYLEVIEEIRDNVFTSLQITPNRTSNTIYARADLSRKNLINIDRDFLAKHNWQEVFMASMDFHSTVSLLSRIKNFTQMVGAGVFNLIFLDKNTNVLEVNPLRENSWAYRFGLSKMCNFDLFVSKSLQATDDPRQHSDFDAHVIFCDDLRDKMVSHFSL